MDLDTVPAALPERLGPEGTNGLVRLFDTVRAEWTADVVALSVDRFERKLVEEVAGLRVDMARGHATVREEMARGHATLREEIAEQGAALRVEIATSRVELLKWSFLFWMGQVAAVGGLMAILLKTVR